MIARATTRSKVRLLGAAIVIGMSCADAWDLKGLADMAKGALDKVAQAGGGLGAHMQDKHGQAQKHLEEQTAKLQQSMEDQAAQLKSQFDWVASYKGKLEDEIGANLEKVMSMGSYGAALTVEKAKALKSSLTNFVLVARGRGAESQEKVNAAASMVTGAVGEKMATAQATAAAGIAAGLATGQKGISYTGDWLRKMKKDMTGLVVQVKEGFDANRDGVIDQMEWSTFAKAFGVSPTAEVAPDGKFSDEALTEALAHSVEEKIKQEQENTSSEEL